MRKTKFDKKAEKLSKTDIKMFLAYEDTAHTITSDNGSVFAQHELIAKKLNADFYFAHPYSS